VEVLDSTQSPELEDLRARDEFFWLDLHDPGEEELRALAERFDWHPLLLEDLTEFSQRPKLDRYGDHMLIVFYGARIDHEGAPALTEVHLVVSGAYVVTVRRKGCKELEEVRRRFQHRDAESEQFVVYRVLDALTDSFFPVIDNLDATMNDLEDAILSRPGDKELQQVSQIKRFLLELRRVVTPQRDLAARTLDDITDLPGLDAGTRDYFRDLYDHLIRISDLIDSYRDLLSTVMDVYLSTVSNRLNAVMKQLTLIATVFLPLTFVTGFFGQNFGWMVRHINSLWAFLILGVGGCLAAVAILYSLFKRSGWLE
jgi:magnesium transporter